MLRANQHHRFVCCWLALTAVDAWTGGAQLGSPSPSAEQRGAQVYRISGRVVDARSGAALSRCVVEIVEVSKGHDARTLQTGEDGSFSFGAIPASKYRLSASYPGFLTQSYEQHDNFSTAIAVGPGRASENLLFKLIPNTIISGTVTDESGEPVRQAQIKLYLDQDVDGIRSTQQRNAAVSDDRGSYELSNIAPGAYFLSVSARPWYATRQQGRPGSRPTNADLDVAYPTTFYPNVTDPDAATPIPAKGGERLQADFSLHAERAMHLRIPLSAAEMRAGYGVSISHSVFGEQDNVGFTITSDGSGTVEADGLLPGHYDVELTKNVGDHQAVSRFSADVADGSASLSDPENNIDVVVAGKVTSSEGKLPAQSGVALVVVHSRRAYYGAVNNAGEFTVHVPPGSYELLGQINHHYLGDVSDTGASLVV